MGNQLIRLIRERTNRWQWLAFLSTFAFSLLVHMYKFTNTLLNHDAVYNLYSTQNMVGSGRWALKAACLLSSAYDLPWLSGVLCCLIIALTAMVIVAVLRIRNPVLIVLCGGLLASSPATTETLFFQFTADGYFFAMLLAALGVWFSRIEESRYSRLILAGACICVSCGIYQAYVSFALILAVCYLIQELFLNRHSPRVYFRWVGRQVLLYVLSLGAYYGIWQWRMAVTGISAYDYQGISQVGTISPELLVHGLKNACRSVADYLLQWDTIRYSWPLYTKLSLIALAALAAILVVAAIVSGTFRRPWALALVGLCLIAIVPFAGIWCFTSFMVSYRPLMLQSLMLIFLLLGVLYEQWAAPLWKNLVALLLAAIVLNNALIANISYLYMNRCYERTYAEALNLAMDIQDARDETPFVDIAILGSGYIDSIWKFMDPDTGALTPASQFYLLSSLLEESLIYDYYQLSQFLSWYLGVDLVLADKGKTNELMEMECVQNMPVWPAGDSLQVIDNTLVIILTEKAGW